MASVYVNEGKIEDLDAILLKQNWQHEVRLFTDDRDPLPGDDITDYTEPAGGGYAPALPTWGPVALNADNNAQTTALLVLFEHDGTGSAESVYGWFLVWNDSISPKVVHAERLVGPSGPALPWANAGDKIAVTPRLIQGECPLVE